jgi:hypothetical protein
MAEMFNPQNPEILELSRQRKMADLLTSQGMQTPQGQTVAGGVYVPPNPMEYLAKLFSTYAGSKANEALDTKEQALAQKLRELGATETKDILSTLRGTPEVVTELAGPAYQGVAPTATMPAKAGDANAALAQALMGQSPQAQRLIPSLIEQANPKPIAEQIKYNLAKEGGYKGTFNDFINQMSEADKARIALEKQRVGLEGARLNLEQQKAAQELMFGKPLTESQAKATAFQSQMIGAENNIKALESKGFDPTSLKTQTILKAAGGVFNPIVSSEAQQYKQAQEQWAESYLRFKTGAAATESEVKRNIETFFPKFGDKPDQIAQKAAARAQAEKDIGFAAGMGAGRGAQPITPSASKTTIPAGVTPELWNVMTPEEKAAFK